MSSRKEQKEQLRREREEREQAARAAERRRRLIGYGAGGALVLAAVVAIGVVLLAGGGGNSDAGGKESADFLPSGGKAPQQQLTDLNAAMKKAGCQIQSTKANSRDHTQSLSDRVKYKTNPPDSGKHFVNPSDDGAYGVAPQDEELVHSMEHGRVIIWVKPSLAKKARADLRALFEEDSYQQIIVPRANMPYAVAATAWTVAPEPLGTGHLMGCKRYDTGVYDALRTFRDQFRGKGPEPAV